MAALGAVVDEILPAFQACSLSLATQNELYLQHKPVALDFEQDALALATARRLLDALHDCSAIEEPVLYRIFPVLCRIADDYRAEQRSVGVRCMAEVLAKSPKDVLLRCNLHAVMYDSLRASLSFTEAPVLLELALSFWLQLTDATEAFCSSAFLQRSDELLLLVLRNLSIQPKGGKNAKLYLACLDGLILQQKLAASRYLGRIFTVLMECAHAETTEAVARCLGSLLQWCWMRWTPEMTNTARSVGSTPLEALLNKLGKNA